MSEGTRRLAAIMFTDIVGYTTLSQRNEALALKLLERHRALMRPVFLRHKGREVKTIGDAFLVQFDSALEAAECAVEMQEVIHNQTDGSSEKLAMKVGIHVGDVVQSDSDVHGDAVNIASRIEPLAKGGEICISQQVYDQIRNKVPFKLVKLDTHELKNVAVPIDVYRVELSWEREEGIPTTQLDARRVAVLPFANMSPDPNDSYFADGMTEEIITTVSGISGLSVISRTSVMGYKGTTKRVGEIGNELNVGSVLEGSFRKVGNRIRITTQLIDAKNDSHVWAQTYDRELDDVFAVQSDIAKHVSDALRVKLLSGEEERIGKKATDSTTAYIRYLKGRSALHDRTEIALTEAKKFFEEAIADDNNYARAYVGLADACFLLGDYAFVPMREALSKANEALTKALSLDEDLPEALTAHANLLQNQYRFAEALREYERAVALNPSYAQAHHWYGVCLWDMGLLEKAAQEMLRAEELDPSSVVIVFNVAVAYSREGNEVEALERVQKIRAIDPASSFAELAMAYIFLNKSDFENAALQEEEVLKKKPGDPATLSLLGFAYGRQGKIDKAHEILERLQQLPEEKFAKSFNLAWVYCGLNERDEMFKYLESSFEERSLIFRALWFGNFDPSIREDPRYVSLFRRAHLPL